MDILVVKIVMAETCADLGQPGKVGVGSVIGLKARDFFLHLVGREVASLRRCRKRCYSHATARSGSRKYGCKSLKEEVKYLRFPEAIVTLLSHRYNSDRLFIRVMRR